MLVERNIKEELHNIMERVEREYKVYTNLGTSEERIQNAQEELEVQFSDEFIEYLREYAGLMAVKWKNGHWVGADLTTLARHDFRRDSIIGVTERMRKICGEKYRTAYVVQENTKKCYVIQVENGEIIEVNDRGEETKIADGFFAYVKMLLE